MGRCGGRGDPADHIFKPPKTYDAANSYHQSVAIITSWHAPPIRQPFFTERAPAEKPRKAEYKNEGCNREHSSEHLAHRDPERPCLKWDRRGVLLKKKCEAVSKDNHQSESRGIPNGPN